MRTLLFVLFGMAVAAAPVVYAESAERTPILVLHEATHEGLPSAETIWSLNALNPTFVLYEDGMVIFKKERRSSESFSAQLTPEQMHALLGELNVKEFLTLEEAYSTNNHLEQPGTVIKYWQDHAMKRVMVSGQIRESAEDRNRAPQAFLRMFDRLTGFHHENARVWVPETLEIHVIPYTNSEGIPVAWPKDWPDLDDETTKDTTEYIGTGESYNLYLSGDRREEFEQLLSNLAEKQAVLMNGRQWYVSPWRYCLPNEDVWKD